LTWVQHAVGCNTMLCVILTCTTLTFDPFRYIGRATKLLYLAMTSEIESKSHINLVIKVAFHNQYIRTMYIKHIHFP